MRAPSGFAQAIPYVSSPSTIAGPYLGAYASEMAWREDHRRVSNGVQYMMTADAALKHPVSRQWKGYWQRCAH